ncbi:hypothetical protein H009_19804 [Agrobacterium tumefaciens str. Cherry 2E-2-2]|uniref:hypothetical protein n=2 Tax=Agrobacterium vitis TaxID=373 RepID=UPI0002CC42B8|nr:hypothetical protein [Agrobacterium vitis]EMS95910.1 hypothetical protein H009_19804 [Agrobacterium tumefaciens str. Cherry 2E-2-2]MCM2471297.1 hypothetical protein [Agrobacterium vitis]
MAENYISPMIPVWVNCRADIGTYAHIRTVEMFLESVALSSLGAIDARMTNLRSSDDPVNLFELSDMEELRAATLSALCLSLQAIWEQQLRGYLSGCAEELAADRPGLVEKLKNKDWDFVKRQFFELRRLPFSQFKAHRDLDLLQLLGNYCRHGEGRASKAIRSDFPEFCTHVPASPSLFPGSSGAPERFDIVLRIADLKRFAGAIVSFWTEAEWIYNNSIGRKHESTVKAIRKREVELKLADVGS